MRFFREFNLLQFKHLTHQRPNLPQLNGHQSFARLRRQRPRRTSDFRSGHDIRIRLPARDITFDTLATDNRRTQSSRRENRTRSLAIQISAHAADLKITRIRNPVRCNRLNRRQRTKILDLRIAKLPFRHIDPIHPTKRNTFSTLADYLRKRTYQNGIYYHLTRDGMGVCDTRIALR